MKPPEPGRPPRFVSAASLFDGHDAAINMIRRLLQSGGAEVVHLGHNRSVADIVRAAIAEDADAIAVSSYQGGHNEYFRYMVDRLKAEGASHIRVVVGGGGTIAPHEVNYRANLWALKEEGVVGVVSVASVGGIRQDLAPGTLLVPDQLIDYTWGRRSTYYEGAASPVTHIDFTEPYSGALRARILAAAQACGEKVVDGGT